MRTDSPGGLQVQQKKLVDSRILSARCNVAYGCIFCLALGAVTLYLCFWDLTLGDENVAPQSAQTSGWSFLPSQVMSMCLHLTAIFLLVELDARQCPLP